MTSRDVDELASRLCNWDRWGPADEVGTPNFITPAVTMAAATLVRSGRVHPLAVPLDSDGPAIDVDFRANPRHYMTILHQERVRVGEVGIADDVLLLSLQGATQWDSLAHVSHRGVMYGGRPVSLVDSRGAHVNDVRNFSGRLATRGVLIDVARARGVETLSPGESIEADEIVRLLDGTGTTVGTGDALLVRTGFLADCRARNWVGFSGDAPGLGMSVLEWLHDHEVAAVATDTYAVEVKPYQVTEVANPFHVVGLVYMGLLLGEIFDLEGLASDCAADGVYDFLFVAPALPVSGGVGSPVNPYAIR